MELKLKIFNMTPLICASEKGHLEIVKELLSKQEIKVNLKNI